MRVKYLQLKQKKFKNQITYIVRKKSMKNYRFRRHDYIDKKRSCFAYYIVFKKQVYRLGLTSKLF